MVGDMFMKKILLIASLLVSMGAWATPLTALLNGGTIIAGDKLFDQWEIFFEDASSGIVVNTDDIEVTALIDGGLDPGPGLHFEVSNGALSATGDGIYAYLDFMFGFRASVIDPDSGLRIKDNSLTLVDYELDNPLFLTSTFIEEKIYSDAGHNDIIGTKEVFAWDDGFGEVSQLADSADFNPASEIWVTKNILLEAIEIGETAEIISFEQRFSQIQTDIPEPSSLILISLGLFGLFSRKNQL